ncbi:MAG TPA: hypothetical protein VHY82_01775 [Acetobacteraceae bacterium]|nr:hypothetical protein [Acetobacteraceae bacterium]
MRFMFILLLSSLLSCGRWVLGHGITLKASRGMPPRPGVDPSALVPASTPAYGQDALGKPLCG